MQRPREKRSGCVIALMIFAGIAVVAIVLAGVGTYMFLQTDEGKRLYATVFDSASLSIKATRAPGVEALHGIGCELPMILTIGEWQRLESSVASLSNEDSDVTVEDDIAEVPLVQCYGTVSVEALPGCDALAIAYVGALQAPPERFIVLAYFEDQQEGTDQIVCTGYYDATGARIGDLGNDFAFVPAQ